MKLVFILIIFCSSCSSSPLHNVEKVKNYDKIWFGWFYNSGDNNYGAYIYKNIEKAKEETLTIDNFPNYEMGTSILVVDSNSFSELKNNIIFNSISKCEYISNEIGINPKEGLYIRFDTIEILKIYNRTDIDCFLNSIKEHLENIRNEKDREQLLQLLDGI